MPHTRLASDAFGVVTICLVSLAAVIGLICIYRAVRFQLRIIRRGYLQLSFFNGPWLTRIALILVSIWWGVGEIARLTLLKGSGRLLIGLAWQKKICEFYIVSNLGFAEPCMFLMFGFLLHASLQGREHGVLSPQWNRKTFGYVAFYILPVFVAQFSLVLVGPKMMENDLRRTKFAGFFRSTSMNEHYGVCTYPLLSTAVLGVFYAFVICYITVAGSRVLSMVINKGLRLRVYLLIFSVIVVLPVRLLLLGFSVLPRQGHPLFETVIFLAFLVLLSSAVVCICILVYFPVSDSLALGDLRHVGIEEVPYDDYYSDATSLISGRCRHDSGRILGESSRRSSISFLPTMARDKPPAVSLDNVSPRSSFNFAFGPSEQPSPDTPMIPLSDMIKY